MLSCILWSTFCTVFYWLTEQNNWTGEKKKRRNSSDWLDCLQTIRDQRCTSTSVRHLAAEDIYNEPSPASQRIERLPQMEHIKEVNGWWMKRGKTFNHQMRDGECVIILERDPQWWQGNPRMGNRVEATLPWSITPWWCSIPHSLSLVCSDLRVWLFARVIF